MTNAFWLLGFVVWALIYTAAICLMVYMIHRGED